MEPKHDSEYWCFVVHDPKDKKGYSSVIKSKSIWGASQKATRKTKKFIEKQSLKAAYITSLWKVTSPREHDTGVKEHEIKPIAR